MNAKLQELIALLRDEDGEVNHISRKAQLSRLLSNEEYFIKVNRKRGAIG